MSDDRTPASNRPEETTENGTPLPGSSPSETPFAPREESSTSDHAAHADANAAHNASDGAPTASAYGEPSAPYGAPASDASAPPATPPYDTTGSSDAPYGASASASPVYGAPPAADAPAYGVPAPDAPAYGAPAYGAPAYAGGAYGASGWGMASARTNSLAIVSLVASLVGLFIIPVIGQIVGIVTGHISLRQIKATGERGRGMGLAGLLIGYISLGLGVLFVIGIAILIAATAGASGSRYGV